MIYFLDSSALVKRYLREPGTDLVESLFRRRRSIAASRIAFAEVAATLARSTRDRRTTSAQRDEQLQRLATDFEQFTVVEARRALIDRVPVLVSRQALRAYGAIQLLSGKAAMDGGTLEFWTADDLLAECAEAEGLRVARLPGAS